LRSSYEADEQCFSLQNCPHRLILQNSFAKEQLQIVASFEEARTARETGKQAGSNWALKEDAVQWEAQKGWRKVRQRCIRSGWWCLYEKTRTDLQGGGGACAERSRSTEPTQT